RLRRGHIRYAAAPPRLDAPGLWPRKSCCSRFGATLQEVFSFHQSCGPHVQRAFDFLPHPPELKTSGVEHLKRIASALTHTICRGRAALDWIGKREENAANRDLEAELVLSQYVAT